MRKEASQPFGGSPRKSQERPDKKETGEDLILGAKTERVTLFFMELFHCPRKKHTAMLAPLAQWSHAGSASFYSGNVQ